ncbi:hypothetical protein ACLB2K_017442 [Fragaria x ananassa]
MIMKKWEQGFLLFYPNFWNEKRVGVRIDMLNLQMGSWFCLLKPLSLPLSLSPTPYRSSTLSPSLPHLHRRSPRRLVLPPQARSLLPRPPPLRRPLRPPVLLLLHPNHPPPPVAKRIDLKDIVAEFETVYNKITDTELAIVSSVVKLELQHLAQIAKQVQKLMGSKNVRIKSEIDPSLVAGFTVRYGNYGSKLIDMSGKKQLEEIAAQLDLGDIKPNL